MRRNKLTVVAALVAAAAMVTAACGSSTDAADGAGDGDSTTSSQEEAPPPADEGDDGDAGDDDTDTPPADEGDGDSDEGDGGDADVPPADTVYCGDAGATPSDADDGSFRFGYVFPLTGDLSFLGPPQVKAMECAIAAINEAGGINGQSVAAPIVGDEANDATLASQAATNEINSGVHAIIGAAATGMTMAIINNVTAAKVAECSGSNTGVVLTDYPGKLGPDGKQYYFRTAPSDALQGPVLGNLVLDDGANDVAVVYRQDDYGQGLADATALAIENGGGTVLMNEGYDVKAQDFAGLVQKIAATDPDAIVTVSFEEGFQLWKQLVEAGLSPANGVNIYGADGMRSETAPQENFDSPTDAAGIAGTAPASVENPGFVKQLTEFAPDLDETQFAPQIYDCVNIFALAAEAAGSNAAEDWVDGVSAVTKDGEVCNTFADCKALLDDGQDIHYVGAGGDLSFTDAGEPGKATIEVYRYNDDGELVSEGTEESVFQG